MQQTASVHKEIREAQELFDNRDRPGLFFESVDNGVSFLKAAKPKKLDEKFRDRWGTDYVANTTNRQKTAYAKWSGEASDGDVSVLSFATAEEQANTNPKFREPIKKGYIDNAEVINVLEEYTILQPTITASGKYEGTRIPVKLHKDDVVATLESAGVPKPKHPIYRGNVWVDSAEDGFVNVGSRWSAAGGRFNAAANRPGNRNPTGLAAFEESGVVSVGRREWEATLRDAQRYRAMKPLANALQIASE